MKRTIATPFAAALLGLTATACQGSDDGFGPALPFDTEGFDGDLEPHIEFEPASADERRGCRFDSQCEDGNTCTQAQCIEHKCVYTPVSGACDDGNGCTLDDQCTGGQCVGNEHLTLLSGTALPAAEGWTRYGDPADSTDTVAVNVDTTSIPLTYRYSTFGLAIDGSRFATHDLQWKMTVYYADHNPFDASAAILPAFSGWYGVGSGERSQMIYFEEDGIGWGDDTASYTVDTTIERTYRLHVSPAGVGEIYVDGQLALTRPGLFTGPMFGFGDQTNDWGVDGDFDIRDLAWVPGSQCKP